MIEMPVKIDVIYRIDVRCTGCGMRLRASWGVSTVAGDHRQLDVDPCGPCLEYDRDGLNKSLYR